MTKENILFGIVGLLAGLIIGFMFANNVNQRAATSQPAASTAATQKQNANMPEGHPNVDGQTESPGPVIDVQAAVDKAKAAPTDFEAQVKAAEVSYRAEKFEQAVEYLKIANKLKPDDYPTVVNIGNAYFDNGKYKDAEEWYSKALATKPEDENVRTDLGLTFIFRDPADYDRAIKEFEAVLAKNINHPQALQNLTVAYTKKGNVAKATETVNKLAEVDPTNVSVTKLREDIAKIK